MEDRLYIDKSRQTEIRGIRNAGYLEFDNQKDVFMYALVMGMDCYNGGVLSSREGFFNDRDLNADDKAIIYSLIVPELDQMEDMIDRDLVFHKAEGMADKGFTLILNEMKDKTIDVFLLQMLNRTNNLYKEAVEKGYMDI